MTLTDQETDPVQAPVRPVFTFSEAAKLTRTSRSTIKRRHSAGAFPSAARDPDGVWLVPLEDLLAAGLVPSDRPLALGVSEDRGQPESDPDQPPSEVVELRHRLALETLRREQAERLAAERLDRVDDLRRALLVLEAAPAAPAGRRWWQRGE